MPTDIIMPQMGESIVEGTITKWLKKPGDKVQRDEPLFEISTDKVDAEIPAPASGVLQEIKVSEGTTVGVNTVVGTISADGESASAPAKAAPAAPPPSRLPVLSQRKKHRPRKRRPAPRLWSAKLPASMASISRKFLAPDSAAASPSRTSWPSSSAPRPHRPAHPRCRNPPPLPPVHVPLTLLPIPVTSSP